MLMCSWCRFSILHIPLHSLSDWESLWEATTASVPFLQQLSLTKTLLLPYPGPLDTCKTAWPLLTLPMTGMVVFFSCLLTSHSCTGHNRSRCWFLFSVCRVHGVADDRLPVWIQKKYVRHMRIQSPNTNSTAIWPALHVGFALIPVWAPGRFFFPYLAAQLSQSRQAAIKTYMTRTGQAFLPPWGSHR